jgi:hypothetical protein
MAAAYIVPPPRRRASPSHKTIGGVYSRRSFRVASFPLVVNPSFNGSKGEGQPLPRGQGPQGKKTANIPVCGFFVQGGVLPPPPPSRHNRAYSARPVFRLPVTICVVRPRLAQVKPPPPEDRPSVSFTGINHPPASGGRVASPVVYE